MDGGSHDLLAVLVEGFGPVAVRAVLHEDVVLHRADGTRAVGRDAVVAMFEAPDDGVRYRVVGTRGPALVVALEAPGVPGVLHFALHGIEAAGLLMEVRVEVRV